MLEEALNMTNEQYRKEHLALVVQKIPTPITPINIDKEHRHITLAYFEQKSTVDYIGNVQGVPICFDAKECAGERFALQNIHEHQMEYMQDFERQDGIAFLIVYFKEAGVYYYVPFRDVKRFWDRAAEGGRKELFASRTGSGLPDTHIKPNIHSLFGCFKPRSGVPSGIVKFINAARVL